MKDWWLKFVAIVAVAFLFAWFFWPTPWVYNQTGEQRSNRFTGATECTEGNGWQPNAAPTSTDHQENNADGTTPSPAPR